MNGYFSAGQETPDGIFFIGADSAVREEDHLCAEGIDVSGRPFQLDLDKGLSFLSLEVFL